MKFSHVFYFAAAATASPFALVNGEMANELAARQGNNLAGVVLQSVMIAATAANSSVATTQQTIMAAGNSITASVQATIEANLGAIADAVNYGGGNITAAVTAAGGNIAAAVAGFTNNQVMQLVDAVNQAIYLLRNLSVTLSVIVTGLGAIAPAVLQAAADELALIKSFIDPFVAPLGSVVHAVQAINAEYNLALQGFDALVPGLVSIIGGLVNSS